MLASYMAEVEYRHMHFVKSEELERNIAKVAAHLTAECPRFGIMFCGTCGNGKTTMLYAMQNATSMLREQGMFDELKKLHFDVGLVVKDAVDLCATAKDKERIDDWLKLKKIDMMAIEDMGKEPTEVLSFGNSVMPIVDIIETRYDKQLYTAITSNLTGKQVREKYGTRVADRLNEMLDVVIFGDKTYRH